MLGIMFSGRQKIAPRVITSLIETELSSGMSSTFFVRRNFFLCLSSFCFPLSFDEFEQLGVEADFHQVGDLIKALEELRGDRRKNKPLSEGLGTIIVYQRYEYGRLFISGRLELVKEIFKEYGTESLEDPQERHVEDYPVSISNMAIPFDFLSGYGFQLESCIHRSGTKYIFMRRK